MVLERKESGSLGSLAQALSEAQSIIQAAEDRATSISAQAEKSFEDARNRGYNEGYTRGVKEASQKAVRLIEESTSIAERLSSEAARLALAISSSIIGEQVKLTPAVVKGIALNALQHSIIGEHVTLIINPEDEQILKSSLEQIRRLAGGVAVALESNSEITRGGCIVRTEFGEVDASVEALLESVAERLGISTNNHHQRNGQ